jgi:ribosomal protein L29
MKSKEVKELVNKTTVDLKKSLDELQKKFADSRHEIHMGKSNKSAQMKEIKRDIARVMTVLTLKKKEEAII